MADFEVIDIVDNITPYQALLGLDWEFENQSIIDLKIRPKKKRFESGYYRVIAPLDPSKGERYVEPTTNKFITEEINQCYRTIVRKEDYINPTADRMLRWRSVISCDLDSDTGLENWQ
jgi:hypothetical protein